MKSGLAVWAIIALSLSGTKANSKSIGIGNTSKSQEKEMSYLGGFDVETRVYFQDRAIVSKRVGAAVVGFVSFCAGVLQLPEVHTAVMALVPLAVPPAWVPPVTAITAATLAAWSKKTDPRPVDPR